MLFSIPWRLAVLLLLSRIVSIVGFHTKFQTRNVDIPSFIRSRDVTAGNSTIGNIGNSQYIANLTIGGAAFKVILDTGSSDLWIAGTVPTSTDTGVSASISYAIGTAAGNIHLAQANFSDFNIASQAYLQVTDSQSFGALASEGVNGLAGLGPGFSSVIRNAAGTKGETLLDNIFQLNKTSSNFITFLLSRNGDPADTFQGEFTISQVVPGHENITNQPHLPVNELSGSSRLNQHWTTLLDNIIGPDGKNIPLSSIVEDTPSGQLVTILDSGFTFPQVPRKVSDAIYGRVQGANYSVQQGMWFIPCGQELNISVVMGGVTFPIHPLDTSSSDFGFKFADGTAACAGTFQPISTAFSLGGDFDAVLGQSFLRNAYTLLNWGDFVDNTSAARGQPYIQLQPLTSQTQAHQDFVNVRLNGVDTTGSPQYKLLSQGKSSPLAPGERVQHIEGFAYRNRYAIGLGCAGALLLIIVSIIFSCVRRRRRQRAALPRDLGNGYRRPPSGAYKEVAGSRAHVPLIDMASQESFHSGSPRH